MGLWLTMLGIGLARQWPSSYQCRIQPLLNNDILLSLLVQEPTIIGKGKPITIDYPMPSPISAVTPDLAPTMVHGVGAMKLLSLVQNIYWQELFIVIINIKCVPSVFLLASIVLIARGEEKKILTIVDVFGNSQHVSTQSWFGGGQSTMHVLQCSSVEGSNVVVRPCLVRDFFWFCNCSTFVCIW